jgi:hypothetical protein
VPDLDLHALIHRPIQRQRRIYSYLTMLVFSSMVKVIPLFPVNKFSELDQCPTEIGINCGLDQSLFILIHDPYV